MKAILTAIVMAALIPMAHADKQSRDYERFETWFARVRMEAPRQGLHLLPGDEEFFYLYCWQSDDHSIAHAIRKAKRVWSPICNLQSAICNSSDGH